MMRAISDAEIILGDGIKVPRESEMEARQLVRRGLKAARDLPAGQLLELTDIAVLRPATGLAPSALLTSVGKKLVTSLNAGDPILETHFSS